jgi:tetratricopeptide (TPR) repeat protein
MSPTDCPAARAITVATCSKPQPPGYGTHMARPLRWGPTVNGGLYFGRLVCPNGGLATARSTARGPNARERAQEWHVRCPGEEADHVWYSMPGMCGDPCPPEGFQVIPEGALEAYAASMDALEAGDLKKALGKAREATRLAPVNELLTSWQGNVLVQAGEAREAVPLFEAAVRMNPDDPEPKLYLAMAQRAAGFTAPYHAAVADLLSKLQAAHPLVPQLKCLQAEHLRAQGKEDEAMTLATESCRAGYEGCCQSR